MDESDQDSLVTNFEIIFPSLLREAQSLHLGLPYDLPYVHLLQTKRQEKLATEYVPSLHEYLKNGITSIGQRIPLSSVVLLMEGQLVAQEVLENEGRRDLIGLNCIIARLADDIQTYKAEKAHGELASYIECYMKDHLECIEEEAMNCIYGILEPTVKEVTRDFLKPERDCTVHIPFTCKKILFDETRVTSVMLKDGDGFGISKIQVMEYIKECLTEPLPIVLSQLKG